MSKLYSLTSLANIIKKKKILKKNIILCHGVFDLIHYGHLKYFEFAKNINSDLKNNFLIVSTTTDKFINKGFGRPYFDEKKRLEMLSNLQMIDAVVLSNQQSSIDILSYIKPGYYVKGQDYKNNKNDKTKKIFLEKKVLYKYGGKIKYSDKITFSSSKLLNSSFPLFNNEQKKIINELKSKNFFFHQIESLLDSINDTQATVLGEIIFDEYHFGDAIGKSAKEPHIVQKFTHKECYSGGSAAISRHLSDFIKRINLISFFGNESEYKKVLMKDFNKNIKLLSFKPNKDFHSIVKKRFLDIKSSYKLFGSYTLPKSEMKENDRNIINIIKKLKTKLLIVSDYGHGLISEKVSEVINNSNFFVALNVQLNSSTIGSHTLKKYSNIDLLVINENELRSELRDDSSEIQLLSKKFIQRNKIKNLVVTRGANGAILLDQKNLYTCPAFVENAVDKVGAGDAMMSIMALCLSHDFDKQLTLFLGCIAGYFSVKSIGNKSTLKKKNFMSFIEYSMK